LEGVSDSPEPASEPSVDPLAVLQGKVVALESKVDAMQNRISVETKLRIATEEKLAASEEKHATLKKVIAFAASL